MRKSNYILSLVFLVLLFYACSPVRVVHTESDPGFKLSNYKTYGFLDVTAKSDSTQVSIPEEYVTALKREVGNQLERRGLTHSDTSPDLLINLGLVVTEKTQTRQTNITTDPPYYLGQRRYTWKTREVEVGKYKQGTVSVHLVDGKQNNLVWSGEVESVVPGKSEKIDERIAKGMEELFSKLPSAGNNR